MKSPCKVTTHASASCPRRVRFVDTWYDRCTNSWVTQLKDADMMQVGAAIYSGTREGALLAHAEKAKEAER